MVRKNTNNHSKGKDRARAAPRYNAPEDDEPGRVKPPFKGKKIPPNKRKTSKNTFADLSATLYSCCLGSWSL